MIDLTAISHIHIIGIGGVSNSAIAEILLEQGHKVTGSDLHATPITEALIEKGVKIYYAHEPEQVKGAELVAYTSAVADDNPEVLAAIEQRIPCVSRAELLGQIMAGYKNSIAISGTHGKTTTTSMVTRIFNDASFDPTALVGGYFSDIKSNVKLGKGELFITEACEYKESFLSFYPKVGVILNIDEDHLDYYKNLDHIVSAFVKFSSNVKDKGSLVLNGDDYNSRKILPYYKGKCITFGLGEHCDYVAKNVTYNNMGYPTFDIFHKEKLVTALSLQVPGQHNIYNALAAFTVALLFTKDIDRIQSALNTFKNANRRFEWIGSEQGITIVDDYAHHPNEIKATLEAASRMTEINRIICIFQPHTYSRTKELLNEFASAFKYADEVILCDIYAAREIDLGEVNSSMLRDAMIKEGVCVIHITDQNAILEHVKKHVVKHDLVITMGAGDVSLLSSQLLKLLKTK